GLEGGGAVDGVPGLDEMQRAAAAGVAGAGAALVLRQPARQGVSDAAVEAAVGTAQDVEVPGHGGFRVSGLKFEVSSSSRSEPNLERSGAGIHPEPEACEIDNACNVIRHSHESAHPSR